MKADSENFVCFIRRLTRGSELKQDLCVFRARKRKENRLSSRSGGHGEGRQEGTNERVGFSMDLTTLKTSRNRRQFDTLRKSIRRRREENQNRDDELAHIEP